ncbi:FIG01269488: protein, clustered with ribosomal protein L32p [hydrothermal vent metagenome]|uniref:FIG01269488: protein, clustered with ribosomal protein L32p n=1 Tax=hydrothermal vent metagenome TaxID=652676 RepID=A0A3B1DDY7_9ZZZZ
MKIIVSGIEEHGIDLNFSERLSRNSLLESIGPVNAHLRIDRRGEEIRIEGNIQGRVALQCSRCLVNFRKELSLDINLLYHPAAEVANEVTYEVSRDEINIGFYSNDELDITQVIREQLILNLPMKALCDETCKGLCPVCGADMNLQRCECRYESVDPRLKSLKKLLSK